MHLVFFALEAYDQADRETRHLELACHEEVHLQSSETLIVSGMGVCVSSYVALIALCIKRLNLNVAHFVEFECYGNCGDGYAGQFKDVIAHVIDLSSVLIESQLAFPLACYEVA